MFIQLLKDAIEEFECFKISNMPIPSFFEVITRSLTELQVYILHKWALNVVFTGEGMIIITDSFKKKDTALGNYVEFPAFDILGNGLEYPLNTIRMNIPDGKLLNIYGINSFLKALMASLKHWSIFKFIETSLLRFKSDLSSEIDTIVNEESKNRIGWTTKTVQTALTFKESENLWTVVIVPHNKELMAPLQMVAIDSKALSEAISSKLNSLIGKPYSILINTLDCIISLSLMPMMVLRDFIQLTKWETTPSNSSLGAEWVFFVPNEAHLDFISYKKTFPFQIDRKNSIIYFVVITVC